MNKTNDVNLRAAAEGDINLLYSIIQDDPSVLERIDSIPFVETPLHIAASKGHVHFAIEVMMLKPSFARKLNQQGFSPIHLAMQNNQNRMVLRFVDINEDLVRIKGREGLTPLHLASQAGETGLLKEFLSACPESIEDVTPRRETALHIAVKNEQYEALQFLVGWLQTNIRRGALKLEYEILNRKDEAGNTILHVSAQNNQSQALRVLLKTMINLKARNLENSTALDIAGNAEIEGILASAGAKRCSKFATLARKLLPKITVLDKISIFLDKISICILRSRRDMSDKQRNALLVVVTLIITTTYESALTPPGGIYQISAGENNVNTTSLNSTTAAVPRNVGKSILSKDNFTSFSIMNIISFMASIMAVSILSPGGIVGTLVVLPMYFFIVCFIFSMSKISPTSFNSRIVDILTLLMVVIWFIIGRHSAFFYLKNRGEKKRATRGNK